jgi:hypothetical protein
MSIARKIILLSLSFLAANHSYIDNAFSEPTSLSKTREQVIVKALLAQIWDPKEVIDSKKEYDKQSEAEQQFSQLWKGNTPKVSSAFVDLELNFLSKKDEKQFQLKMDVYQDRLRLVHSKTLLPQFKGGALFEGDWKDSRRVSRIFLPGKDDSGILIFSPLWKDKSDLYTLICPRKLVPREKEKLGLVNTDVQLQSLLLNLSAELKARLYSGKYVGSILATLEHTAAIPRSKNTKDFSKAVNPTVDLRYFPVSDIKPAPFSASGEAAESLMFKIDMQLPSGYRRTTLDQYDLWVKKVEIEPITVAVPISTALACGASSAVTPQLLDQSWAAGMETSVDGGACYLVIGEKRMQKDLYFDKESIIKSQ